MGPQRGAQKLKTVFEKLVSVKSFHDKTSTEPPTIRSRDGWCYFANWPSFFLFLNGWQSYERKKLQNKRSAKSKDNRPLRMNTMMARKRRHRRLLTIVIPIRLIEARYIMTTCTSRAARKLPSRIRTPFPTRRVENTSLLVTGNHHSKIMHKWNIKYYDALSEKPDAFLVRLQVSQWLMSICDADLMEVIPFFWSGIAPIWFRGSRQL